VCFGKFESLNPLLSTPVKFIEIKNFQLNSLILFMCNLDLQGVDWINVAEGGDE
jgi:hypothetical protein